MMTETPLKKRFHEALLQLLRSDFKDLSEAELYTVFAAVMQDLRTPVPATSKPETSKPAPPTLDAPKAAPLEEKDTDSGKEPSTGTPNSSPEPKVASAGDDEAETSGEPSGEDDPTELAKEALEPTRDPDSWDMDFDGNSNSPDGAPKPEAALAPAPKWQIYVNQIDGVWQLGFDLYDVAAIDDFTNQLVGTGGLFVDVEQDLELNTEMDVCVIFPATREEVWFGGRVVFQSASGVAIDTKPATEDWESIFQAARSLLQGMANPSETPSGGPTTQPPRLRKPKAVRKKPPVLRRATPSSTTAPPPEDAIPDRNPAPAAPTEPAPPPEAPPSPEPPPPQPAADQAAAAPVPPPMQPPAQPYPVPPPGYPHPYPATQPPPGYGMPAPPHYGAGPPQWSTPHWQAPSPWAQPSLAAPPMAAGPLDTRSIADTVGMRSAAISGPIDQNNPLALYFTDVASRQEDGVIVIRSSSTYYVVIQVGCPVDVRMAPHNPDYHLGALLVQAGKLTWEQHKEAERLSAEASLPYEAALVRLRHLPYQASLAALQSRIVFVLGQIFQTVGTGEFEYYDLGPLPQRYNTPPVSIAKIAFKYVFSRWRSQTKDKMLAVLAPWDQAHVRKANPPPIPLAEIQLNKKHLRFWEVILAEDLRVRSVPSVSNLGNADTLAILLTLRELGFVQFDKTNDDSAMTSRLIGQVNEMHSKIGGASHFDVLRLHWSAYSELIEKGYRDNKEAFALDSWPEAIHDDIRHEIKEIQSALDTAYEAVKNKKARRTYRERIVNSMQLDNGIQLYFRKGDMAMLRRDARGAQQAFLRVLELQPSHKEARQNLTVIQSAARKAKE
jgi:hypothetical protein